MDSLSTPIVSAANPPILNPNEFDLWKMRIEQYFLMTDYSLWDVIINGDSPAPTVVIDGVVLPVTILFADQKLARRNELKAHGTLLIALPDKHQLKFTSYKDAKTLMQKLVSQLEVHGVSLSQEDVNLKFLCSLPSEWKTHTLIWRNKADLEEHSLDDLFNSLRIYEVEVKHSSTPGNPTQNLAFVSSSNTDSTTDLVSAATSVSAVCAQLPVSSYPTIDSLSNAAIFSFFASQSTSPQECRSPKDTRKTSAAEPQRRNTRVETSTSNALVSQCNGIGSYDWSYQAEEEPVNFALMAITSSSSSSDNESLTELLANQTNDKHGLGYFSESDSESLSTSSLFNRIQPSGGYHAVPPLITGNLMPPKPDLVFHTAPIAVETGHSAFTVQLSPTKPAQDMSHITRPMAPITEDWVSDLEDESQPNDPQSVPGFVQTSEHVKPFGHFVQPVEAPILGATPMPTSPKTNCSGKRKNRKTCFVCKSVDHLIKDCNFHAIPKDQPTPRNYAHRGYNKQHVSFTRKYPQKHIVPTAVLTKSKPVSVTTVRLVSVAVSKIMISRPRHAHPLNTKSNSTIRRHKTRSQSSKISKSAKASVVSVVKGKKGKWVWRPKCLILDHDSRTTGNPQYSLKDKGVIDSGCSQNMTVNMSYLSNFQELNSGYVAFGGNPKGDKISGKGKIKTGKLDFEDVYFVKELKFNLFSISQMCDKKNKVFFTDSECPVLSPDFKLPDKSQVLLRVPREKNMYNVNLKDIVPSGDLTCLFVKATTDKSNLWHRRLRHDETSPILKTFITGIENQLSLKVKVIRSDNGTEFKIFNLNQFCELKGIKREFSVPRTPLQNGIAKRKNRTLIEAARTMLADSLLPIPFWAEAVNTACYVQNRVC
nr:ribonuclease H-like domain-containing protein [Tanacetum cinerariifolium]